MCAKSLIYKAFEVDAQITCKLPLGNNKTGEALSLAGNEADNALAAANERTEKAIGAAAERADKSIRKSWKAVGDFLNGRKRGAEQ